MNQEDRIVVFREFDSAIQANIIKAKLDAFDIPCFLTDENNPYPSHSIISHGVRLHVFHEDIDHINAILEEQNLHVSEESIMCPKCGSNHIENVTSNRILNTIRNAFSHLFSIPEYTCLRCGKEF